MDSIGGVSGYSYPTQTNPTNLAAGTVKTSDPKDALIASLQDENAEMRAELEKMKQQIQTPAQPAAESPKEKTGKLEIDLATNTFKMTDVRTNDFIVDRLNVKVPGVTDMINKICDLDNFMGENNHIPLSLVSELQNNPMTVLDARIRVPEESANQILTKNPKVDLAAEGIREPYMEFADGNRLIIGGKMKKVVPFPFKIKGEFSVTYNNKVAFTLEKASILGFLPIPKIIAKFAMAFMDKKTEEAGLERKGDTYIMNPDDFLPANTKVKITGIKTENHHLVIEGAAPDENQKSDSNPDIQPKKPNNPITIAPDFEN